MKKIFQIQFLDRNKKEINTGDWLKVLCRNFGSNYMVFYVQMQTIKGNLIPHDAFAWESLEKVEEKDIPKNCVKSKGDSGYEYYYQPGKEEGEDTQHHLSFITELGIHRHACVIKEVEV